jgi:hypothetical protein
MPLSVEKYAETGGNGRDEILLSEPVGATESAAAEHLTSVLQSDTLRGAPNLRRLLEYIGTRSLSDRATALKEYTIGVEALDRPTTFDPKTDTIVRVQVHRLREKLARYYSSEGRKSGIRINIPSGGYRATFEIGEQLGLSNPAEDQILEKVTLSEDSDSANILLSKRGVLGVLRLRYVVIVFFLISAAAFSIFWSRSLSARDSFHEFWHPMLAARAPTMIYLGTNNSFRLTPDFVSRYREKYKLPDRGFDQAIDISREEVSASDLKSNGPLIGLGDTAAASRIAWVLAGFHKTYDMRYGQDLGVTDLHATPAVLIGGFSNRRSIEMTQELRFRLEQGDRIVEHGGRNRSWIIRYSPEGRVVDDYVVVSRIPKSETGGFVLAIAGVATFSNQAAADFICDANQMNALLRGAPAGWEHKNMQVVLHTRAIEMIPVSTNVEAVSYW